VKFSNRDDIVQLTPLWKGERFDDGRPRVSDDIVRRMKFCTTEEAWGYPYEKGYKFQWEGEWFMPHPDRVLVGRAVTAVFVPHRPDLHDYLMNYGQKEEKRIGAMNSWVIQTLQKNDVVVVDLFEKIYEGTFTGGNLSTAISSRGGNGQVIFGGMRDLQQVETIKDFVTFCKGIDPTGINNVTLVGLNTPCRIGRALCMPGDVVHGTKSGVTFVPAHLAQDTVEYSEKTRMREAFGFAMVRKGKYNSSQVDSEWTGEMEAEFEDWKKKLSPKEVEKILWEVSY
jgi:regulator of RNase E activity RraA